jgi:hypothetical protein
MKIATRKQKTEIETKTIRVVIPAPYHVRAKLHAESRVLGENRDPAFKMVPDFRRDDVWTPPYQVPLVKHGAG